jgi:hypothetical protein
MPKQLIVETNFPPLASALSRSAPLGVVVTSRQPMEKRGIDVNMTINLDVKLLIDLTKISAIVCATWLARSIRRGKPEIKVRLNGKNIPEDEAAAIKFIAREIGSERQNDRGDN